MSPRRCPTPITAAARTALGRMTVAGGGQLRDERLRRRMTLDQVASRAGVGRATVHRSESGEPVTLGCPDPLHTFEAWWRGEPPTAGVASTLVLLDPALKLGRRRRFVGLEAVDRVERRYRGYAEAAATVSASRYFR